MKICKESTNTLELARSIVGDTLLETHSIYSVIKENMQKEVVKTICYLQCYGEAQYKKGYEAGVKEQKRRYMKLVEPSSRKTAEKELLQVKDQVTEEVAMGKLVKRIGNSIGITVKDFSMDTGVSYKVIEKILTTLKCGEDWNVYSSKPGGNMKYITYGGVIEVIHILKENNMITCEKMLEIISQLLVLPEKADKVSLKTIFQRIGRLHKEALS